MNDLTRAAQLLRVTSPLGAVGKVAHACGHLVRVTGLPLRIGALCRIFDDSADWQIEAEVVGLTPEGALLTPFGSLRGLSSRARVVEAGAVQSVPAGRALLGRVVDGNARPIDGRGELKGKCRAALYATPPDPMLRRPVDEVAVSGVRAIDSLLTCGIGQRTGIFAAAGGGKSTLLGMLARGSGADVNVIALIGERGREVNEFIRDNLGDSLERSVVVVATADRPPLERARATCVATAIAESFRAEGLHVQLLVDSVTRYARALREVGLAAGEPPTRGGYPPSVFTVLPQLFERAGNDAHGAISAWYTVLVEDEEGGDPVAEEVRSLLDGHVVLSRELARRSHYPAIDVLASASRIMPALVSDAHAGHAADARGLLASYREIELLVQLGEYKRGADPQADRAIDCEGALRAHLMQPPAECVAFDDSLASLANAIGS